MDKSLKTRADLVNQMKMNPEEAMEAMITMTACVAYLLEIYFSEHNCDEFTFPDGELWDKDNVEEMKAWIYVMTEERTKGNLDASH